MRFAKLRCEGDAAPWGIEELASSAQLDFLQLDYPRPRWATVDGSGTAALAEYAVGFGEALRAIAKPLYLDPQLRVIASAGWADAYSCVERAAGILLDAGCGDAHVAAVRGSNLLPILDMLHRDGVNLANCETGACWRELKAPVLAADLQLGAGPLAAALDEHARIVVAGAFDETAPLIASAVSQWGWSWRHYDLLAAAVAAARAATWLDWQSLTIENEKNYWGASQVELDGSGAIQVESSVADADADAVNRLQRWLRDDQSSGDATLHADVRENQSTLQCSVAGPGQLTINGAQGSVGDDCWRLNIMYEAGFSVEAMIEFATDCDPRWRQRLASIVRNCFCPDRAAAGSLTVDELQSASGAGGGWLHLTYHSKTPADCRRFADQVVKLALAHRPLARLPAGWPAVHARCELWPVRVPRDAIDIAVETRPAREWV